MSEPKTQSLTDAQLERLPIFPLPKAQLFPDAILPLHVFEPRYRELVEHVMREGHNALGVATLRPGYEPDYEGRPAVYPTLGAGVIMAAEKQGDGRWNILVRGLTRVRIVAEHDQQHLFREVRAQRLYDEDPADDALEERLRALVMQLADHAADASRALHLILSQAPDAASLTNLLGAHACSDARLRQKMLETTDVSRRLEMACNHLGRLLLEVAEPPAGGVDTMH